jgi:hypothetical protein
MAFWISIQFLLNFIRISSQGSVGPFVWYKQSNGSVPFITSQLQYTQVNKVPYGAKDVFDLQFPHYNKFIDYTKTRKDEDGVFIAGTYLQYFLHNQKNIKLDGMTNRLWEM